MNASFSIKPRGCSASKRHAREGLARAPLRRRLPLCPANALPLPGLLAPLPLLFTQFSDRWPDHHGAQRGAGDE